MFVCITEASAPGLHVAVRPASWAPRVRAGASGQGACTDSWQVAAQVPGGGPQCRAAGGGKNNKEGTNERAEPL